MNDIRPHLVPLVVLAVLLWVVISGMVFKLRHPWATETEELLYFHKALLFQKVPYNEMRPRE